MRALREDSTVSPVRASCVVCAHTCHILGYSGAGEYGVRWACSRLTVHTYQTLCWLWLCIFTGYICSCTHAHNHLGLHLTVSVTHIHVVHQHVCTCARICTKTWVISAGTFTSRRRSYIHADMLRSRMTAQLPVLKVWRCCFFCCLAFHPFLGLLDGVQHLVFLRVVQWLANLGI
jgi:hypothetical protein